MAFQGSTQLENRHKLLCLIDEFPSLKRMDVFADTLSYMGGYGIKAYLIAKDIRQIVQEHGPHESIVSNCHVRVSVEAGDRRGPLSNDGYKDNREGHSLIFQARD